MIWLTERERLALGVLGGLACAALGVLLWQQHRTVIRVEPGDPPPYAQWEAMVQRARQVDLNHASAEELERLPQIGPSLAKRIVEYRSAHGGFRSADELQQVPGIGPKKIEQIRDYVSVTE